MFDIEFTRDIYKENLDHNLIKLMEFQEILVDMQLKIISLQLSGNQQAVNENKVKFNILFNACELMSSMYTSCKMYQHNYFNEKNKLQESYFKINEMEAEIEKIKSVLNAN